MPLKPLSPTHEPVYVVLSVLAGDDPTSIVPHLPDHLAYLKPHYEAGRMTMGGAFQSLEGEANGDGMYMLSVSSLEEALSIAENDPFHLRGLRRFRMVIWQRKMSF